MRLFTALFVALVLCVTAHAASAQLIPDGAEPEKVADGYRFTEGPACGPDGCIYFTDIPAELILKYDPETGETETYFDGTGQANGLMFDPEGRLIGCTHGSRMLVHFNRISDIRWTAGAAGPNHFEGNKLNSPNDLAIDRVGNIYFTDPRYGNRDSMEMDVEGVYFRSAERNEDPDVDDGFDNESGVAFFKLLIRIEGDLTRPNGIVLSPDESILYIADNGTNEVFAYDVEAPGEIENKRLFARLNDGEGAGPDGMCVDAHGRLYAAGQGKIWIYNPDGSDAGVIAVGPACTNCTFGADGKTLYITANRGLYRIELNTDEPVAMRNWLQHPGVMIEVTAELPWPVNANAVPAIEINKDREPWQVQGGVGTAVSSARGGRRSTMREIWRPAGYRLVRVAFDSDADDSLILHIFDETPGPLSLVSEEGNFYSAIGYVLDHGGDSMDLSVRQARGIDQVGIEDLPEVEGADKLYVYFQVPIGETITGSAIRNDVISMDDPMSISEDE